MYKERNLTFRIIALLMIPIAAIVIAFYSNKIEKKYKFNYY